MKNLLIIILFAIIFFHYGCKENSSIQPTDHDTGFVVRKPNIYIYPEKNIQLSIKINFPLGGHITESIPLYNNGWIISVDANGKIDNNYDYLFYECSVPNHFQKKFGWVIDKKNLKTFFETNLHSYGFNEKEIKDFIDYWIPRLNDFSFYEIYPQTNIEFDKLVKIKFSLEPDEFFRLIYYIQGRSNENLILPEPSIVKAKRTNYHIMEWGVVN